MAMFAVVFYGKCSTQTALHRLKLGRSDTFRDKWWSMPAGVGRALAFKEGGADSGQTQPLLKKGLW